jgi:hypothetical protein
VATEAIAGRSGVPEFGVSEDESVDFMQKVQNVLRHYSVETTQKGIDFIALLGSGSMIVGTRVAAYNMRVRMETEQRSQARPFNVVQMPQNGQAPRQQPNPGSPVVEPQMPMDDHTGF